MKRIRFGLCCLFISEPIKFKTIRYSYFSKLSKQEQIEKIDKTILWNLDSLEKALLFCRNNGIGCFRITSTFLPLFTHPKIKYDIKDLPHYKEIKTKFSKNKIFSKSNNIRLTLHPDQFTVLSSPKPEVIKNSINNLMYHAYLSNLLDVDVINIHIGGAYGEKKSAIKRFEKNFRILPSDIKDKLTIENDDIIYTPSDLLPLFQKYNIPLVYDVHHHRCNPDEMSINEASVKAYRTWNREPVFHISSAKNDSLQKSHSDYIKTEDFPTIWKKMAPLTVEVEAKSKELAVLDLIKKIY